MSDIKVIDPETIYVGPYVPQTIPYDLLSVYKTTDSKTSTAYPSTPSSVIAYDTGRAVPVNSLYGTYLSELYSNVLPTEKKNPPSNIDPINLSSIGIVRFYYDGIFTVDKAICSSAVSWSITDGGSVVYDSSNQSKFPKDFYKKKASSQDFVRVTLAGKEYTFPFVSIDRDTVSFSFYVASDGAIILRNTSLRYGNPIWSVTSGNFSEVYYGNRVVIPASISGSSFSVTLSIDGRSTSKTVQRFSSWMAPTPTHSRTSVETVTQSKYTDWYMYGRMMSFIAYSSSKTLLCGRSAIGIINSSAEEPSSYTLAASAVTGYTFTGADYDNGYFFVLEWNGLSLRIIRLPESASFTNSTQYDSAKTVIATVFSNGGWLDDKNNEMKTNIVVSGGYILVITPQTIYKYNLSGTLIGTLSNPYPQFRATKQFPYLLLTNLRMTLILDLASVINSGSTANAKLLHVSPWSNPYVGDPYYNYSGHIPQVLYDNFSESFLCLYPNIKWEEDAEWTNYYNGQYPCSPQITDPNEYCAFCAIVGVSSIPTELNQSSLPSTALVKEPMASFVIPNNVFPYRYDIAYRFPPTLYRMSKIFPLRTTQNKIYYCTAESSEDNLDEGDGLIYVCAYTRAFDTYQLPDDSIYISSDRGFAPFTVTFYGGSSVLDRVFTGNGNEVVYRSQEGQPISITYSSVGTYFATFEVYTQSGYIRKFFNITVAQQKVSNPKKTFIFGSYTFYLSNDGLTLYVYSGDTLYSTISLTNSCTDFTVFDNGTSIVIGLVYYNSRLVEIRSLTGSLLSSTQVIRHPCSIAGDTEGVYVTDCIEGSFNSLTPSLQLSFKTEFYGSGSNVLVRQQTIYGSSSIYTLYQGKLFEANGSQILVRNPITQEIENTIATGFIVTDFSVIPRGENLIVVAVGEPSQKLGIFYLDGTVESIQSIDFGYSSVISKSDYFYLVHDSSPMLRKYNLFGGYLGLESPLDEAIPIPRGCGVTSYKDGWAFLTFDNYYRVARIDKYSGVPVVQLGSYGTNDREHPLYFHSLSYVYCEDRVVTVFDYSANLFVSLAYYLFDFGDGASITKPIIQSSGVVYLNAADIYRPSFLLSGIGSVPSLELIRPKQSFFFQEGVSYADLLLPKKELASSGSEVSQESGLLDGKRPFQIIYGETSYLDVIYGDAELELPKASLNIFSVYTPFGFSSISLPKRIVRLLTHDLYLQRRAPAISGEGYVSIFGESDVVLPVYILFTAGYPFGYGEAALVTPSTKLFINVYKNIFGASSITLKNRTLASVILQQIDGKSALVMLKKKLHSSAIALTKCDIDIDRRVLIEISE